MTDKPQVNILKLTIASVAWAPLMHVALVLVAAGLAVEFRSGIPLLALGGVLTGGLLRANYEAAKAHAAHAEKMIEMREVAKLKFEAAIRANRVTGTDTSSVLMATMEAAHMGISQEELKEISDRVGGERGEHMRHDSSDDG